MALFPKVISQLPFGWLITLNHFSHGWGSTVFCVTLILNMDLPVLHTMLLLKLFVDWYQMLIHHSSVPNSIVSYQWSNDYFLNSELSLAMGSCSLNVPVAPCSPSPSINWLDKRERRSFEDSVTVSGNTLWGHGNLLHEAVYALN